MFKSFGYLELNNGLRIKIEEDFLNYYKKLIYYFTYNTKKYFAPKHGCHITITNPKIHDKTNYNRVLKYVGRKVEFEYNPENIKIGGQTKGFTNYYIPVECEFANKIKKVLRIKDDYGFLGLHITICSDKLINRR